MTTTYVVARYKEDIGWLDELPADAVVYLYNKGPEIDPGTIRRPIRLKQLRNAGRESGTYLHFLMHDYQPGETEFVVFTQADPFEHSPDFLELAKVTHRWRDIQPLSLLWRVDKKMPPMPVLEEERSDWLDALPIRAEHFSLRTWAPVSFFDEGAWGIGTTYRAKHMLPNGANVAAHFLEFIGLEAAALEASASEVGVFSYGAIFAVRDAVVAKFVRTAGPHLPKIELLTRADLNYGYIFERMWMHLFGEPFVRFEPLKRPEAATTALPTAKAAPLSLERVVAPPLRTSGGNLRDQAFAALGRGRVDEARALLQKALFANPVSSEVLSDLAALAFQQGDHALAIPYARRALAAQPGHGASRFTLAMCLSATGRADEAIEHLQALTTGTAGASFRRAEPELASMAAAEAARLRPESPAEAPRAPTALRALSSSLDTR